MKGFDNEGEDIPFYRTSYLLEDFETGGYLSPSLYLDTTQV
jgi:hypothetical protein